jgi:hypothetical protein
MSFAGNTLDLIRTVINRRNLSPVGPSYFDSINSNAISYSNVTLGPQNGYNDYLTDSVKLDQDLMSRYADYEDMDDFPELGSALDLYADDATVQDVITNKSMWFEADDEAVENVLNDMLDINLRAEESLWEVTRSLCKYGNEFNELMVMDKVGLIRMSHVPPPSMRRIEDINGILYGFIHDPSMTFRMDTATFLNRIKEKGAGELTPLPQSGGSYLQDLMQVYEPWEVVHFRLRGKARRDLYGYSSLEAARWAWKRLTMIEDAMVLYKLTRAPQRYAYYVDVGDVPPQQAKGFLNRIKNEFKKTKFIDPATNKPSFRHNPLSMDEDIFLPVRKGKRSTEIEVLNGPDGQQIDDAQYFLNKIFAALKIPKSYLGADETVGRANLSQMDSRFSRTVMRIQREVKNGYNHMARVDLAAKNIDPDKVKFECHMVVPSGVFELAQMEVQQAKLDLGQRYKDANFSEYYVWSEVLGMADEDIEKVQGQRVKERGDAGEYDADGEGNMAEIMPKAIDQARDKMDKKATEKTERLLTEVAQNQTVFAKKINELKGLTRELSHVTRNQKYYNGRKK